MLFNPKWNAHPIVSLEGLTAWLEQQDPTEKYDFLGCFGHCLFSRYIEARGIEFSFETKQPEWEQLHVAFYHVAAERPWTFGAALDRARAAAA